MKAQTAMAAGLASCHDCGGLKAIEGEHVQCPRCGSVMHLRKPDSLNRVWALTVASAILYIPANVLPITRTEALGKEQADTIMSGVLYFLKHGDWPLALVIFTASVALPFIKIFVLLFLAWTTQQRSTWRPLDRTRLYRITELVGRWSMVDIYVVTILVALVQLGVLAQITAGPGALYFALVVVLTMFAAESYDPRLIWDAVDDQEEPAPQSAVAQQPQEQNA
jgi:paraquat-inducible protein A